MEAHAAAPPQRIVQANPAGVAIAALAAVAMVIAVFLPMADAPGAFAGISQNSMVQHGGWEFILLAVLIATAAYSAYNGSRSTIALVILGLIAIGLAYRAGTDQSVLSLYPLDQSGNPDTTAQAVVAKPGIGIWLAGVAGALAVIGGWVLRTTTASRSQTVAAPAPVAVPPSWHPDPYGERRLRWWDGSQWTSQTDD